MRSAQLVAGLLLCAQAWVALAAENDTEGNVAVSLVSEVESIQPGSSFWVGFRQVIKSGWHTYWRNPGDSGAPTKLTWDLPEGFTASEIHWPFPERIPYGPLMNFGYHDEVMLLVEVTAPADARPGPVTRAAKAEWLVCEDICIPEKSDLALSLPVRRAAMQKRQSSVDLFATARQRIPQPLAVDTSFTADAEQVLISIALPDMEQNRIETVAYFPFEEGVIDYPKPQQMQLAAAALEIKMVTGWQFDGDSSMDGVVVITEQVGEELKTSFVVRPRSRVRGAADMDFGLAILFAFVGGMILNLMPCVFPVLSIKILTLVEGADRAIRLHGAVYFVGVVISFVLIAASLLALRAAGEQIGWGFQLQSPFVVALLVYLFALIGLSLSGYFEMGLSWMGLGGSLAERQGYSGSFFTGVLATVVAAPCTAPFMGAAIGFAVTQSTPSALAVFASLGAGMATPYLALCFMPALLRRLPRPGPWMVRLKELLAFPMFASAVWLVWVLDQQIGPDGVLMVLSGVLALVLAIWLLRQQRARGGVRWHLRVISVLLVAGALVLVGQLPTGQPNTAAADTTTDQVVRIYSESALAAARDKGPVFVNFTAAWCITCKVNELAALKSERVQDIFLKRGIEYLKADWTNQDPAITSALARYGRTGVPLYLLFPGGNDDPVVLPQILTESIVIDAVESL